MTETTLSIEGMTCASCVARVEKRLMRLEGVTAEVNLATEKARVSHPETVDTARLTAAVASAGYAATVEAPARDDARGHGAREDGDGGSHGPGAGATATTLRTRLVVSAILAVPVVVLAMVPAWQFDNWQWLSLVLAAPVVVWGGYPFHRATVVNLRHGALTMDTLITLGTGAALLWSVWALFLGTAGMPGMTHAFTLFPSDADPTANIYLETAAGVTVLLLLGREIERASRARAGDALRELLSLGAKDVTVLRAGAETTIPIERLAAGDLFVVRPGETVATDGVVVEGAAAVDESMITGESVPVEVGPGDTVTGGTIAGDGRLVVRAVSVGDDTRLARMARLVEDAQLGKGRVQRLADRISAVFIPIVIGIAVLSFAGWLLAGGTLAAAFTAAVAVLIIACPCALGLATPVALLVGTSRGARLGILISSADALERARGIDTVLLDKTGTVTTGEMSAMRVVAAPGQDERRLRDLAASLEAASEHPIARAIAGVSDARLRVEEFTSVPARGVSGVVGGAAVLAGSAAFVEASGVSWPDGLAAAAAAAETAGESVTVVAVDGEAAGFVTVADRARPDAASAVAAMRALGLEPVLLTGDNEHVAHRVAQEAGIRAVHSRQSPEDKVRRVRAMQEDGRVVAMVGDGVNDAAALAAADLGMAMGSGTDVAIAASDITILRHDLGAVADAVRLSRRTLGVIRGNLFWAFAYNVAAIPLAALGLLNPMIAGAAMAFSSVFVVLNSLRLRGFRSASADVVSAAVR